MEKNNTLVKAINKNVRTSPRKLALVCNFIKGKKADKALRDLEVEPLLHRHAYYTVNEIPGRK